MPISGNGTWERIHTTLRERVRRQAGREPTPSAAIIDSQSVKTAERGGPHGYDGAKQLSGRKRHLLVDTLGLVRKVVVHVTSLQDRQGVKLLLDPIQDVFPRLRKVWVDSGYTGKGQEWIEQAMGWEVEVVRHPWRPRGMWVVPGMEMDPEVLALFERSFAWIGRNRRMSKDYEYLPATSETGVYLSMIRVMLKRLAHEEVVPAFHYRHVA